jgi:hypothetical protein
MLLTLIKKCSLEKNTVTDEDGNENERSLISKNVASLVQQTSKGYESSENNQTSHRKRSTSSSSTLHNDLGGVEVLSSKVLAIHNK